MIDVVQWAAFRTHVLIAGDVVGSIIRDRPTWTGLTEDGGVFRRNGVPVLEVLKVVAPKLTTVKVRALADGVWLQEPGLTVAIAGIGKWRGVGRNGRYVATTRGVQGWLPLAQQDPFRSTVHFTRVKTNPDYAMGVDYRDAGGDRIRIRCDGGFTSLLDSMPRADVPWQGCQVFGQPWKLLGVVESDAALREWELAGGARLPDVVGPVGQLHLIGWKGGAGVVVNASGRTPKPGRPPDASFNRLWDPRSWRHLGRGQSIAMTVAARRF